MRIVFANRSSLLAGGADKYLERAVRVLVSEGHEVAVWWEHRWSTGAQVELPASVLEWVQEESAPLDAVRAWRPDIVYCNGLDDPRLEHELEGIAPSLYSAHAYFGTCISGAKMHAFPTPRPCSRVFGAACLALYLPLRCGGRSPVTMLSRYMIEGERLAAIRRYSVVVVHSHHMQAEYARHGVRSELVPLPVPGVGPRARPLIDGDEINLLFLGRMSEMKGGMILIEAATILARVVNRSFRLTFAGDGVDRDRWQASAERAMCTAPNLKVDFERWVGNERRSELLARTHALVVPSCWPEPFGMVGLEAAAFGVPSVAFAVGGIVDWLEDGVNGCLAPASPPNAKSLAEAIGRCVQSSSDHAHLAEGAGRAHARFASHSFGRDLLAVLAKARANHADP